MRARLRFTLATIPKSAKNNQEKQRQDLRCLPRGMKARSNAPAMLFIREIRPFSLQALSKNLLPSSALPVPCKTQPKRSVGVHCAECTAILDSPHFGIRHVEYHSNGPYAISERPGTSAVFIRV